MIMSAYQVSYESSRTFCLLIIPSHHVSLSFICSEGLGEGYDGDIAFASALETFGGGHNDPISVAFGGMSN